MSRRPADVNDIACYRLGTDLITNFAPSVKNDTLSINQEVFNTEVLNNDDAVAKAVSETVLK
jgi:hypothetical protein